MHVNEHTETKSTIMGKAELLFMRFGLKSVSMDDITRELGISKKTLYQYFESKEDLIMQTIQRHQCAESEAIASIIRESKDALHEMLAIARHVIVQFQQMAPVTIYDLKKYYPEAWRMVEQVQREYIYNILLANMKRGVEEGLYRSDFNTDILARLYVGSTKLLLDEEFFPNKSYHWDRLYREFVQYHLRGIVSAQGLEKLQHYIKDL